MTSKFLTLSVCLFLISFARAQTGDVRLLGKGGASEYGVFSVSGVAGGGSSNRWGTGVMFGCGVEYQSSRSLSLLGIVDFSSYVLNWSGVGSPIVNTPRKFIVDLSFDLKLSIGFVYFLGGVLISHESTDEVRYGVFAGNEAVDPSRSGLQIGSLLGLGVSFPIAAKVALFGEANVRLRSYNTLVAQIGFSFAL